MAGSGALDGRFRGSGVHEAPVRPAGCKGQKAPTNSFFAGTLYLTAFLPIATMTGDLVTADSGDRAAFFFFF